MVPDLAPFWRQNLGPPGKRVQGTGEPGPGHPQNGTQGTNRSCPSGLRSKIVGGQGRWRPFARGLLAPLFAKTRAAQRQGPTHYFPSKNRNAETAESRARYSVHEILRFRVCGFCVVFKFQTRGELLNPAENMQKRPWPRPSFAFLLFCGYWSPGGWSPGPLPPVFGLRRVALPGGVGLRETNSRGTGLR